LGDSSASGRPRERSHIGTARSRQQWADTHTAPSAMAAVLLRALTLCAALAIVRPDCYDQDTLLVASVPYNDTFCRMDEAQDHIIARTAATVGQTFYTPDALDLTQVRVYMAGDTGPSSYRMQVLPHSAIVACSQYFHYMLCYLIHVTHAHTRRAERGGGWGGNGKTHIRIAVRLPLCFLKYARRRPVPYPSCALEARQVPESRLARSHARVPSLQR